MQLLPLHPSRRQPRTRGFALPSLASALLILSLALALAAPAVAEEPLVTDRPDQTESAVVVPRGTVQLETGATFTHDEEGSVEEETRELAQTLLRIGLTDWAELRVGWAGHQRVELSGARSGVQRSEISGVGDADLGFKLARQPDGGGVQLALLASTSVPVGADELTSDAYDPQVRLALSHDLPSGAGLAYNVGVAQESEKGGRTTDLAFATAALGFGLTERLGSFVELFGEVPLDGEEESLSFDTGLTWLVNDLMQLDVAAGLGLNDPAPDWFVTVGFSWRFPR